MLIWSQVLISIQLSTGDQVAQVLLLSQLDFLKTSSFHEIFLKIVYVRFCYDPNTTSGTNGILIDFKLKILYELLRWVLSIFLGDGKVKFGLWSIINSIIFQFYVFESFTYDNSLL